ncbi:MAG: hypothetical protein J6S49_01055 [Erysipelotrichaceae bacterium]|nr:hypothetical protein [Erysipelotrichaceae bacterium]MBO7698625.1 hypothetical protein [Erysipelotrichaceae bacterium]MBP5279097.1 hypothetical protein [Erysipelotrichaceae bacterium]
MEKINDSNLEEVVGGSLAFNPRTGIMTYARKDGSKESFEILDYKNARQLSRDLFIHLVPEEKIINQLIEKEYLKKLEQTK